MTLFTPKIGQLAGLTVTAVLVVIAPAHAGEVGETAVISEAIANSVDASEGTANASRMQLENGRSDQENARDGRRKGKLLSYGRVLKRLSATVTGSVLKVKLNQRTGGIWSYDFTVLDSSGRYVSVSLNAATGDLISKQVK